MTNLFFLAIAMFSVGYSSFIIAGLLPQIGQSFEQPTAKVGQGITSFSLAYLFSAPVLSLIFGNKKIKLSLLWALGIFLIGNFATYLSSSLFEFLLGRAIAGIGAGFFTPLCVTIAVNLGHSSNKGKALSIVWGANSAGVVLEFQ